MNVYFPSDEYHTPANAPRAVVDRLLLGSRCYFVAKYSAIVLRCRKAALEHRYGREEWAASSNDIFRLIERSGGRFHMTGLENIRSCRPPVVFISNHMSTLETMIFPGIIAPHMRVTFVVKESLVRHPFFGPIMRSRNPIVVSRENSREDLTTVLMQGRKLLEEGTSIIIFPQSSRRVVFKPEEFNSLGVKLAGRAGVQVVPAAVKTDFWGNGKLVRDLGPIDRTKPIHMAFGEAMNIAGTGKDEHNAIVRFVQDHLRKWEEETLLR